VTCQRVLSRCVILHINNGELVTLAETLVNLEFPQHMDVLPFPMTEKSSEMEKKVKLHFTFFVL
jgi:hypothetical protein